MTGPLPLSFALVRDRAVRWVAAAPLPGGAGSLGRAPQHGAVGAGPAERRRERSGVGLWGLRALAGPAVTRCGSLREPVPVRGEVAPLGGAKKWGAVECEEVHIAPGSCVGKGGEWRLHMVRMFGM